MNKLLFLLILLSETAAFAQSVKVMTYNIRLDHVSDGVNQWPNRKTKVFDLIRKYNPDIFGVQEALPNQMEDLAQNLPAYSYIGVGRDDGKNKGEFSALFYKKDSYKLIDQNTFWLSETPTIPGSKSWDAAITRVATWGKFVDLKTSNQFVVVNTHFDHIGKEARKNSAELLLKQATQISGVLPLIITGDFNCTREEPPYTVILNANHKLSDPAPKPAPGTFCGFEVNAIECRAIDYIFHSPHWKAKEYKVITDRDGKYYPSDHLPVMVELSK
ncbi:MAG TPA: endonuclease/exonuclease/phosphatase family protein [Cyclobacteriaceae bacterium]